MRGAVFKGPGSIEIQTVSDPECGNDDIILRVLACGICGSDLHSLRTGDFVRPGQIMGHEFVGEVIEVGDNVQDIPIDERVVGTSVNFCGECLWCKSGEYIYCPELFKTSIGYGRPGAFADYVKIENAVLNQNVFVVPTEISNEDASMAEPIGVAALTAQKVQHPSYTKSLVMGAGIIGNMVAQIFKNEYKYEVVMSEPSLFRREHIYGVDHVIDPINENVVEVLQDLWGEGEYHFGTGGMVDVVVDCAGSKQTFPEALEAVRSKGTVGLVALPDKPVPVNLMRIVHKAPEIIGVLGSNMGKAIKLITDRKVKLDSLVTHRYALDDISEAFKTQQDPNVSIKVVVVP